jgi:FtsH-binding integral membrane protein
LFHGLLGKPHDVWRVPQEQNMNNNNRRTRPKEAYPRALTNSVATHLRMRAFLLAVYNYLIGGLALAGLVAFVTHDSSLDRAIAGSLLFWPIVLLPFVFAIVVAAAFDAFGEELAQAIFWSGSILVGLSLGTAFPVLAGLSIAPVLFVLATSFGGISLYGHLTEADPSAADAMLMMILTGTFAALLATWVVDHPVPIFIASAAGVIAIACSTVLGMRRIKQMHLENGPHEDPGKDSIRAALSLYVDLINLLIPRQRGI